jgi:hypothetical protein
MKGSHVLHKTLNFDNYQSYHRRVVLGVAPATWLVRNASFLPGRAIEANGCCERADSSDPETDDNKRGRLQSRHIRPATFPHNFRVH